MSTPELLKMIALAMGKSPASISLSAGVAERGCDCIGKTSRGATLDDANLRVDLELCASHVEMALDQDFARGD